ncbi:MAG: hypothetical protein ACREUL_11835 [Steroidobacteraceae bacterium]
MSRDLDGTADFEQRLRVLLDESVQRVGGRVRSRLTQARHAALAEAARPRRWHLRLRPAAWGRGRLLWMPAAGAVAAAVLVAFVLWPHPPQGIYPAVEASHATVEDLDLLADRDGIDLMQGGDGQFYEWAMAQAEAAPRGQPSSDPGAAGQGPGQVQNRGQQEPDPGAGQNIG